MTGQGSTRMPRPGPSPPAGPPPPPLMGSFPAWTRDTFRPWQSLNEPPCQPWLKTTTEVAGFCRGCSGRAFLARFSGLELVSEPRTS